jgi:hypothetical protein
MTFSLLWFAKLNALGVVTILLLQFSLSKGIIVVTNLLLQLSKGNLLDKLLSSSLRKNLLALLTFQDFHLRLQPSIACHAHSEDGNPSLQTNHVEAKVGENERYYTLIKSKTPSLGLALGVGHCRW